MDLHMIQITVLKFAHPKSLAAPIHRPALGRPSASVSKPQLKPEASEPVANRISPATVPQQEAADSEMSTNAGGGKFESLLTEPSAPTLRPVRSTRNPSPNYVDAMQWSSLRPWSASGEEIEALNRAIGK